MFNMPVVPKDDADKARWREQSLRHRLLTGAHADDVRKEIEAMFCKEVAADLEINPDLSRNPFLMIWQQLNVAYLEPPEVRTEEEVDLAPVVTPKLWAQMQQTSLFTLAMNECLVRLDWRHWLDDKEVSYRVVTPDKVVIDSLHGQPDMPGRVEELRTRDGKPTWEIWDVRDPSEPVFKIEAIEDGERVDKTLHYAPELAGDYPYRDTDGTPILPYIMYHSKVSSQLWHWTSGSEISAGALRLCALFTHWGDGYTNAAYPQKYVIDLDTQAGHTRTIGGSAVDVVPVDRKSIIKFQSKGPGGGSVGSFAQAFSPLEGIEALKVYEQGLAIYAGLNPSDLQVTGAQSGYSIVVSRAGQRRAQRLIAPSLRISDQLLLATAAKLANFYGAAGLPEDPRAYTINYRSMKPTAEEQASLSDSLAKRLDLGVISQLDAIRELYPEIETDEEGIRRIIKVRELEKALQELSSEPEQVIEPEPIEL
tara:strand:+ start:719 stop:2155 length:1437 start_codon:yes stop_codon:yes gene_type:complete